jgi:hypothetical protein
MFLGSRARSVHKTDNLTAMPSVSRLSRQCGILNISQPYRPPRPVTGIALLYGDGVLPVRYELDCKYCYK